MRTQGSFPGGKLAGAGHSPPSCTEVKNGVAVTSTVAYVFMAYSQIVG
jgi:hypothetical protein